MLLDAVKNHYSKPGGFVGRCLAYRVESGGLYLGAIVAGSATMHLQGRNEFFSISRNELGGIVNNVLFHIEPPWRNPPIYWDWLAGKSRVHLNRNYPIRNTAQKVLAQWREKVTKDWLAQYEQEVKGFETLVQPPRIGSVYRRDGWQVVGMTKGFSCRRVAGTAAGEKFGGKRVWTFDPSNKKLIFCKMVGPKKSL